MYTEFPVFPHFDSSLTVGLDTAGGVAERGKYESVFWDAARVRHAQAKILIGFYVE